MAKPTNITPEVAEEISRILRGKEFDSLPFHRRAVTANGANVQWLRKNLARNLLVTPRLAQLLGIR